MGTHTPSEQLMPNDPALWDRALPKFEGTMKKDVRWIVRPRSDLSGITVKNPQGELSLPLTAKRARKLADWLNLFADWLERKESFKTPV